MDLHSFLDITEQQIRSKRARPMVLKELSNHVEDQKMDYMSEGMTDREAEQEAVREMGDPVMVGAQLDKVHRPKMEWKILAVVLLLSVIGIVIQLYIQLLAVNGVDQNGAAKTYLYLQQAQAFVIRNQLQWMMIGILLMLLICCMNYSLIGKYAVLLWAAVVVATFLYCKLATPVNGGYVKIAPLSYLCAPIYAGIIYRYRNTGTKGLLKCMFSFGITFYIQLMIPSLLTALMVGLTGTILLTIAIHEGWFGTKKRQRWLLAWGPILVIGLIGMAMLFSHRFAPYQEERIKAMVSGHPGEEYQWREESIASIVDSRKNKEEVQYTQEEELGLREEIKSDYLLLFISKNWGNLVVWGVTFAVLFLIFLMFRASMKQRNRLGYIIGIGCSALLLIQTFLYVAINFGVLPFGGTLFMPLLSYGPSNLIVTYVYMGLLLSVYRNKDLITN